MALCAVGDCSGTIAEPWERRRRVRASGMLAVAPPSSTRRSASNDEDCPDGINAHVTWWRVRETVVWTPQGRPHSRRTSKPSEDEKRVTLRRLSVRGGLRKSSSVGTRGNDEELRMPLRIPAYVPLLLRPVPLPGEPLPGAPAGLMAT